MLEQYLFTFLLLCSEIISFKDDNDEGCCLVAIFLYKFLALFFYAFSF